MNKTIYPNDPFVDNPNNCTLMHSIVQSELSQVLPIQTLNKEISILSWNIQGIGNKLELKGIHDLIKNYDVIFLFETMKLDDFRPDIPGYNYLHCQRSFQHPRARRPSGGIAVLIKDELKNIVKIDKSTEFVIWLKFTQIQQVPIFIGGVYVPSQGFFIKLNYSRKIDPTTSSTSRLKNFLI